MRLKHLAVVAILLAFETKAFCFLDPQKSITQYTRSVWTEAEGLPQDVVRAIAQTPDGYLWLGTAEGLARFDGYEFVNFDKGHKQLPDNSVMSLAAGAAGELWIGTTKGLVHYRSDGDPETFTRSNGLPDDDISQVLRGHNGVVWLLAGPYLCRLESRKITVLRPGVDLPLISVRTIYEDPDHNIWIGGYGGAARLIEGRFVFVKGTEISTGGPIVSLIKDRQGNLWMGSNRLRILARDGRLTVHAAVNGLPDRPIRFLHEDHDGNVWLGTDGGLSRFRNGKFEALGQGLTHVRDRVRSMYEDSEGDLWVGLNAGLSRFRDDVFTTYSKAEGLPSDEPAAVDQDAAGNIWIGFQNAGLIRIDPNDPHRYEVVKGLPDQEVFSIAHTARGGLVIATRGGLSIYERGHFTTFAPSHKMNHQLLYDALEDRNGRIWTASDEGLSQLVNGKFQTVIPGGLDPADFMAVLCQGMGSVLWSGSRGNGLWRVENGRVRHFATVNGLSSDKIRALTQSSDGTLWIGTSGGGLNSFRDGTFRHYGSSEGMISDNIFHIEDDGRGSLWLSTTRGLSRVSKKDLAELAAGKIRSLSPVNYGLAEGLRNFQCASSGLTCRAVLAADGRLWLPTGRGVVVLDPKQREREAAAPKMHLTEMFVMGRPADVTQKGRFPAGTTDVQLRYAGIHLRAPEAVRYAYKLEGLDNKWVSVFGRRSITYTNLQFGHYRFVVRGELKHGIASETSYDFEIAPHFYETLWFKCFSIMFLLAATVLAYRLHLGRIRGRFVLVLEERTRIAREIHDTLAQGFVGISSQLEALSMCFETRPETARECLDLARKMTRHSLIEARRSVADLRASALEGKDLASALEEEAQRWTAGSNLHVQLDISKHFARLPHEIEQNLLRIAQEAVTNTRKHASAAKLLVQLCVEARHLCLRIADDGCGCLNPDLSSSPQGHFGLVGMRERAESIGGRFRLHSEPKGGMLVEVKVPLAGRT